MRLIQESLAKIRSAWGGAPISLQLSAAMSVAVLLITSVYLTLDLKLLAARSGEMEQATEESLIPALKSVIEHSMLSGEHRHTGKFFSALKRSGLDESILLLDADKRVVDTGDLEKGRPPRKHPAPSRDPRSHRVTDFPLAAESACIRCHGTGKPILGYVRFTSSRREQNAARAAHLKAHFLILLGFIVALGLATAAIVRRHIQAPLGLLVAAMDRMGSGESDTYIAELPGAEFKSIAEGFNLMSSRIERRDSLKTVINKLLHLSLQDLPLSKLMELALDELLTIPWLTLESKGGIFLVERETAVLVMKAQRGLGAQVQTMCARVPFGECLCGRTAQSGRLVHAADLDERHEHHYQGMSPHGHYCVPIKHEGRVSGVVVLYLRPGHECNPQEVSFLESVAAVLSIIVARHQTDRLLAALKDIPQKTGTLADTEAVLAAAASGICEAAGWSVGEVWTPVNGEVLVCRYSWHLPEERFGAFAAASGGFQFPPGVGLPGRVWATLAPAWVEDVTAAPNFPRREHALRAGLRSALAVPVLSQGKLVAVLDFFKTDSIPADRRFVDFVSVVAGQVGEVLRGQELAEQLLHSQKMDAIGRLAGGVAHDFNNLLTAILGYSEFVMNGLRPEDPMRGDVAEIKTAAQRAAALTRQLLAFSRKQRLLPRVLDLNESVSELAKMLRRLLGDGVELALELSPEACRVKADAGQIEQVIVNLAVNARDAMPKGGRLLMRTGPAELGGEEAARAELAAGRYALLSVADTGTGMSREVRARIFEPFFTTKEQGKGTGLGLATVFGIVKQSGGGIMVESEPGRGSEFRIYLPWTQEERKKETAAAEPAPARGRGVVLLVEDEEQVRSLAARSLRAAGFEVHEAARADAALAQVKAGLEPGLLLTDVALPGLGGKDLAREVAASRPGVKILFMSGFTESVSAEQALGAGDDLIQKPFTPEQLTRRVVQALAG